MPGNEIAIEFTKLSPGEKLREEMVSSSESIEPAHDTRLRRIRSPEIDADLFGAQIEGLARIVERRDLAPLAEALVRLVPEYEPSGSLLRAKRPLVRAAAK